MCHQQLSRSMFVGVHSPYHDECVSREAALTSTCHTALFSRRSEMQQPERVRKTLSSSLGFGSYPHRGVRLNTTGSACVCVLLCACAARFPTRLLQKTIFVLDQRPVSINVSIAENHRHHRHSQLSGPNNLLNVHQNHDFSSTQFHQHDWHSQRSKKMLRRVKSSAS